MGANSPKCLFPLCDPRAGGLEPLGRVQQPEQESERLKRARTDSTLLRTAVSNTTTTTVAMASLELLPLALTSAEAGARAGVKPGAGAGAGGPRNHSIGLAEFDVESSFQGSDCDMESDSDHGSSGDGQIGSTGSRCLRRHRLEETEQGGLRVGGVGRMNENAQGEEDDNLGGKQGGGEVVAVRERTQAQRYSTSIPSLGVPADTGGGDGGGGGGGGGVGGGEPLDLVQSPLEVSVKRPLSFIDEAMVSNGEQSGDDVNGDDGEDDGDESEGSYVSISRRRGSSFSQMSSAGRRASVSIRKQVRPTSSNRT